MRKTIQRAFILDTVKSLRSHPTIDEVFLEVRRKHPRIGRATVYRNLSQLAEEGEILSITLPASPMRVDGRVSTHYHFRCRQCGNILDIDADLESVLEQKVKAPDGARIETHSIVFGGLCRQCNNSVNEIKERS